MKTWICVGFAAAVMFSGVAQAYPEPSLVPGINDWTLDVEFDHPQQIAVRLPGEDQPRRYWYLILTLTNNSSVSAVPFYPTCHLVTDTFQVVEAGRHYRQGVFELIKLKHQGKYPFLEPIEKVDHTILQGRDNARDVCIIWPDFDPQAKEVKFFIEGLSNETVMVPHPIETLPSGLPKPVYLRKTLALTYATGGDVSLRSRLDMKFLDKKWVMR